MLSALRDPHISVAQIAADHFIENGKEADALTYRQLARDTFHWSVRARLFQAANRHIPYFYTITKNNLRFEITQLIRNARNAYNKASLLRALAEDPRNYSLLIEEANDSTNAPFVRTSAAEALGAITADRQLSEIFRGAIRNVESQLFEFFKEACLSGDAGLTAVAIKFYNSGRNIKLEIALARGKRKRDKRESIKERDTKRDIERTLKSQY